MLCRRRGAAARPGRAVGKGSEGATAAAKAESGVLRREPGPAQYATKLPPKARVMATTLTGLPRTASGAITARPGATSPGSGSTTRVAKPSPHLKTAMPIVYHYYLLGKLNEAGYWHCHAQSRFQLDREPQPPERGLPKVGNR